jgi:HEAT repeat protein
MAAWEEFLEEFFGRPRRDGPDLRVLDALTDPEREQAVDLLLTAACRGDIRAIQGLVHLRARRAVEPLRTVMREYDGFVRVYAAAALWWLDRDPQALATLCREAVRRPRLRGAPHRAHAAAVLSQIDDDAARRALAQVIHDPEYELRYHAYHGLASVLGRRREIWNYVCKPDIHHHVRGRIDERLRRAGLLPATP